MSRTQGSARQEAERLVVTMLAMASQGRSRSDGWGMLGDAVTGLVGQATGGTHGGAGRAGGGPHGGAGRAEGWSTGTPECCVCPVCRVIAGLRDPDPQVAERLATGAGDFAAGVASLLRAFSTVTGATSGDTSDAAATTSATTTSATTTSGATTSGSTTAGATTASTGSGAAGPADRGDAAGRRTSDDPWAAATSAGHDPTARVPRPARTTTVPGAPDVTAGVARSRDPWAAATTAPAATAPATTAPATTAPPATAPAAGARAATAGAGPAVPVDDRVADTGDDAPPAAAV